MKKKLFLIIVILLMTACNVDYNLVFEDGIFKEEAKISFPKATDIKEKIGDFHLEIKGNEKYKLEEAETTDASIAKLSYEYDKISFENSYVFNCFSEKEFIERKDHYVIKLYLGNEVKCPYINNIKINFKTDYKVLYHNATSFNVKEGRYKWNDMKGTIELRVSRKLKEDSKNASSYYRPLALILAMAVGGVIIFISHRRSKI